MDAMLIATTNFARLLLGSIFLANLALWVFRYSAAGQVGTLLGIAAMVAVWYSQEQYLHAGTYEAAPDETGAAQLANYLERMRTGNIARWVCVVATACSVLCLIFG